MERLGADLFTILVINVVLSGDNAVLIALAVRNLPGRQRLWGTVVGAGLAVMLRVVLTFAAARVLTLGLIKLVGGAVITWMAVRLLRHQGAGQGVDPGPRGSLLQAVRTVLVADLIMSMDNVLAIAAACRGDLGLLLFGLGTSIPLVVGGAQLLCGLMERYPVIVWVGAALLGKVGGELIATDPVIAKLVHPSREMEWMVQLFCAGVVVVLGRLWNARGGR